MCLRGREIAALTLDHIDWKRERLAIPERKADHSRTFPSPGWSVKRSWISCNADVRD
jgi:hypothetical protein